MTNDRQTTSRSRWAAIGAAIAVSIGAGGLMTASATIDTGERAVFVPIVPCRVMDTRSGSDNVGPRSTPIGSSETHTISVLGVNGNCTIPADATGLAMNVTIINPTANSFLTVFPSGAVRPLASNLNWVAGQPPVPNAVTADVPGDGKVSFYNLTGTVNVAADIIGYFVDHSHDDRYYTKAQTDAKTLFASVNADGTLRRGSAGVTSALFPAGFTGDYLVTFPRNVSTCVFVASTASTVEGNNPVP
ncbi:MAG: hypothetical protein ABIW84_08910, partial [Ilumatobacteraceae bacterium]